MDNMSPEKHINNLLSNIRVAFTYVDEDMSKKLITTLVRPRLEYAPTVWSPRKRRKKT